MLIPSGCKLPTQNIRCAVPPVRVAHSARIRKVRMGMGRLATGRSNTPSDLNKNGIYKANKANTIVVFNNISILYINKTVVLNL